MRLELPSALSAAAFLSFLLTGCTPMNSDGTESGQQSSSFVPPGDTSAVPAHPQIGHIPTVPMFIDGCNLGCGSGSGGADVGCTIAHVHTNHELRIEFSQRVDLQSVDAQTFQLTQVGTGTIPTGTFLRNPANPMMLIFRPSVDIAPTGELVFGFDGGQIYQVFLPGEAHPDVGPFVLDVYGQKNQSRMDCLMSTTLGVGDYEPGDPTVQVFVDVADDYGNIIPDQPADGAVNVSAQTEIEMVFDDIMATQTLLDPVTGTSPYISVMVDPDGDTSDQSDQVSLPGSFTIALNPDINTTTLTFIPSAGLPPAGSAPLRIVMNLGTVPTDAAGNLLSNAGEIVFTPEGGVLPPLVLAESFDDTTGEDGLGTGAQWGQGQLTWSIGGGSGRLGDLVIHDGEEVVLNTDSQEFPLPGQPWSLLDNSIPGTDYDPLNSSTWPKITVTDGDFEFSSVVIEAGGKLILEGDQPARLFARGQVINDGEIDVAGVSALDHRGNTGGGHYNNGDFGQESKYGGAGGLSGTLAGDGGQGADRINGEDATQPLMINVGGIIFDPPYDAVNDGSDGEGVGAGSTSGVTGTAGRGGVHWPPSLPTHNNMNIQPGYGDAEVSVVPPNDSGGAECGVAMVGGPGSGGAYAMNGGDGIPVSSYTPVNPGLLSNTPPPTPGGDNSALGLGAPGDDNLVRKLAWYVGNLRGGSGGGGGGTSLYGSRLNAGGPPDCYNASLFPFFDHSAAGGGGGGGALQVAAGRLLTLGGVIDCGGGSGGSALNPGTTLFMNCDHSGNTGQTPDCEDFAAPGGGGSGGAIKLQSREIELGPEASRLIVSGGLGGIGAGGSLGGDGSPGLLRIEREGFVDVDTDADLFGPRIEPYYPDGGPSGFNEPYLSAMILSVGPWGEQYLRPESFGGAMSCWMKPDVPFWSFDPLDDLSSDPLALASTKGWNMKVRYVTPTGIEEFWYRGQSVVADPDNPLDGITDFETYLGTLLNHDEPSNAGSLFTLRFQGVRVLADHDLCDLDLADAGGEIMPGSLTPWVRHPAELNLFGVEINRIRFCVVLDPWLQRFGLIESNIVGITDVEVGIQTD